MYIQLYNENHEKNQEFKNNIPVPELRVGEVRNTSADILIGNAYPYTGYELYRCMDPEFKAGIVLISLGVLPESGVVDLGKFNNEGLSSGITYYYRIIGLNGTDASAMSPIISLTTVADAPYIYLIKGDISGFFRGDPVISLYFDENLASFSGDAALQQGVNTFLLNFKSISGNKVEFVVSDLGFVSTDMNGDYFVDLSAGAMVGVSGDTHTLVEDFPLTNGLYEVPTVTLTSSLLGSRPANDITIYYDYHATPLGADGLQIERRLKGRTTWDFLKSEMIIDDTYWFTVVNNPLDSEYEFRARVMKIYNSRAYYGLYSNIYQQGTPPLPVHSIKTEIEPLWNLSGSNAMRIWWVSPGATTRWITIKAYDVDTNALVGSDGRYASGVGGNAGHVCQYGPNKGQRIRYEFHVENAWGWSEVSVSEYNHVHEQDLYVTDLGRKMNSSITFLFGGVSHVINDVNTTYKYSVSYDSPTLEIQSMNAALYDLTNDIYPNRYKTNHKQFVTRIEKEYYVDSTPLKDTITTIPIIPGRTTRFSFKNEISSAYIVNVYKGNTTAAGNLMATATYADSSFHGINLTSDEVIGEWTYEFLRSNFSSTPRPSIDIYEEVNIVRIVGTSDASTHSISVTNIQEHTSNRKMDEVSYTGLALNQKQTLWYPAEIGSGDYYVEPPLTANSTLYVDVKNREAKTEIWVNGIRKATTHRKQYTSGGDSTNFGNPVGVFEDWTAERFMDYTAEDMKHMEFYLQDFSTTIKRVDDFATAAALPGLPMKTDFRQRLWVSGLKPSDQIRIRCQNTYLDNATTMSTKMTLHYSGKQKTRNFHKHLPLMVQKWSIKGGYLTITFSQPITGFDHRGFQLSAPYVVTGSNFTSGTKQVRLSINQVITAGTKVKLRYNDEFPVSATIDGEVLLLGLMYYSEIVAQ